MIIVFILLDQIAKYFAYTIKPDFDILGSFLRIQYMENTGTIFGLFENSNVIFMVLAILLCIVIIVYMKKNIKKKSLKEKAFMLILAGGIGNLIDRVLRGFVVDFISLKWVGIFNLADSYIVIGVIAIIILEMIDMAKTNQREKSDE